MAANPNGVPDADPWYLVTWYPLPLIEPDPGDVGEEVVSAAAAEPAEPTVLGSVLTGEDRRDRRMWVLSRLDTLELRPGETAVALDGMGLRVPGTQEPFSFPASILLLADSTRPLLIKLLRELPLIPSLAILTPAIEVALWRSVRPLPLVSRAAESLHRALMAMVWQLCHCSTDPTVQARFLAVWSDAINTYADRWYSENWVKCYQEKKKKKKKPQKKKQQQPLPEPHQILLAAEIYTRCVLQAAWGTVATARGFNTAALPGWCNYSSTTTAAESAFDDEDYLSSLMEEIEVPFEPVADKPLHEQLEELELGGLGSCEIRQELGSKDQLESFVQGKAGDLAANGASHYSLYSLRCLVAKIEETRGRLPRNSLELLDVSVFDQIVQSDLTEAPTAESG